MPSDWWEAGIARLLLGLDIFYNPPMLFADPDFPHVVLSFDYRGFRLELDQSSEDGVPLYAVWATYATGCAVAVQGVVSRSEAIYKARQWVDRRLS